MHAMVCVDGCAFCVVTKNGENLIFDRVNSINRTTDGMSLVCCDCMEIESIMESQEKLNRE